MKKKAYLLVVLALFVVSILSGCGGAKKEEPKSETSGDANVAVEEVKEINVAYICKNTVDPFHQTVNNKCAELLDAMVEEGSINSWQLYDGLTDPVTQVNLLDTAITNGANLVLILPAEAAGSDPVITKCAEEGIPCIVVNSRTTSTEDKATAFVGSDDVLSGEMMGEYIIEMFPEGGKYIHLQGVIGNSAQIDRGTGIANTLGADSKFEMVGEYACEWLADKAVSATSDALTTFGDEIVAIVCDNDDMSAAAQNYCNSIGRSDIICIGVDGNPGPMDMIEAGTLRATVLNPGADQITAAINMIPDVVAGKEVESISDIPFVFITKDNVAEYK